MLKRKITDLFTSKVFNVLLFAVDVMFYYLLIHFFAVTFSAYSFKLFMGLLVAMPLTVILSLLPKEWNFILPSRLFTNYVKSRKVKKTANRALSKTPVNKSNMNQRTPRLWERIPSYFQKELKSYLNSKMITLNQITQLLSNIPMLAKLLAGVMPIPLFMKYHEKIMVFSDAFIQLNSQINEQDIKKIISENENIVTEYADQISQFESVQKDPASLEIGEKMQMKFSDIYKDKKGHKYHINAYLDDIIGFVQQLENKEIRQNRGISDLGYEWIKCNLRLILGKTDRIPKSKYSNLHQANLTNNLTIQKYLSFFWHMAGHPGNLQRGVSTELARANLIQACGDFDNEATVEFGYKCTKGICDSILRMMFSSGIWSDQLGWVVTASENLSPYQFALSMSEKIKGRIKFLILYGTENGICISKDTVNEHFKIFENDNEGYPSQFFSFYAREQHNSKKLILSSRDTFAATLDHICSSEKINLSQLKNITPG